MNTAALLARTRTLHQTVMIDTITVTRETLGDLDEETGEYPIVTTEVYAGPGRIRPAGTATVDAAGIAVETTRPILDIPWTEAGAVQPGDRVAAVNWPHVAEVFAETAGTTSTSRRYTLEVQTS
jgi:hypothetical protein